MLPAFVFLAALGLLIWGYFRTRPYGQLGVLAWLQSVVLTAPWLVLFGLVGVGVYPNLAVVLMLVVLSAGVYIALGRRLRQRGQQLGQTPSEQTTAQTTAPVEAEAVSAGMAADIDARRSEQAASQPDTPTDALPKISAADLSAIEEIFSIDTFFRTETFPYQSGAYFQGNLRGQPDTTAQTLSDRLHERLGDRYRLSLIEGPEGRPVAVVLPAEADPQPLSMAQRILAVALAIATVVTSLETSGILLGFDITQNWSRLPEVLPLALGLWAVLLVHEAGHRWQAQRHGVKLSPPFFLPAWQLGSFGGLTQFESLLPNRTVLFDVAFAGPAAGGMLALGLLLVGLLLSHPGSYFELPTPFFQQSILVGTLARTVLGAEAFQGDLVDVHPLTVVGWLGLVITALNVVPAGRLDGGRVVQGIYGRRIASRATFVTLIVLAVVALGNPIALYWAFLILFLQRGQERPCTNDLSDPDDARAGLALLILFLMLAVLLPLTPTLAGRIGLGG